MRPPEGSDTPHNTKTPKSMEHSDMEALGFQLRNYYDPCCITTAPSV